MVSLLSPDEKEALREDRELLEWQLLSQRMLMSL